MTVTLMTGFMNTCTHIHQGEFARDELKGTERSVYKALCLNIG